MKPTRCLDKLDMTFFFRLFWQTVASRVQRFSTSSGEWAR